MNEFIYDLCLFVSCDSTRSCLREIVIIILIAKDYGVKVSTFIAISIVDSEGGIFKVPVIEGRYLGV